MPLLLPCCFTYCIRSSHLTLEAAHSQPGQPCPSSNLERALQPLMDHQWSLIHQIVGKFTPITLKPSLFVHLAAGLWVAYHCLQPLMSISLMKPLLTTILYQDSHCAQSLRWLGEIASLPSIRVECLKGRAVSVLAFLKCFPSVYTQKVLNLISLMCRSHFNTHSISDHQLFLCLLDSTHGT